MRLSSVQSVVFSALVQASIVIATNSSHITSVLKAANLSAGTHIYYPTDVNYTSEVIQRWTTHDAPTYAAAVKPATGEDVRKIVHACASQDVPFLATGGSHGFTTTYDRLQNGLEVDMGLLNSVKVDSKAQTLTIGASVIFRDVFNPVFDAGFEVVTGSSPCVGMIGATLGGGVGRYNGLHGMILDTLLSVDFVTANGTRLTASKSENSDLFWGIRGAGMNLGVAVSATYQIFPLTSRTVMNWDLTFSLNQSRPVMEWFKNFEEKQDPKLSLIFQLIYDEKTYGGLGILVNAVYIGPEEEGVKYVQPLLTNTGRPLTSNLSTPSFAALPTVALDGTQTDVCTKGNPFDDYSGSVDTYDVDAFLSYFQDLQTFLRANPGLQESFFYIEQFAKTGPLSFPENSTAYPWRNQTANLLFVYIYNSTDQETTINDFAVKQRAFLQEKSGYAKQQLYVSYGHGDEGPDVWYGSHVHRLSRLKTEWDPTDAFSFNNPVPQLGKSA